jgi:hypothetical protein
MLVTWLLATFDTAGELILAGARQLTAWVYKQHVAPKLGLFLTSPAVSLLAMWLDAAIRVYIDVIAVLV